MRIQRKSNLNVSLQSLAVVLVMLFGMAFACGDDNDSRDDGRGQTQTGKLTEEIVVSEIRRFWGKSDTEYDHTVKIHNIKIGEPKPIPKGDDRWVPGGMLYPVKAHYTRSSYRRAYKTTTAVERRWTMTCVFTHNDEWECAGNGMQKGDTEY